MIIDPNDQIKEKKHSTLRIDNDIDTLKKTLTKWKFIQVIKKFS
jgi:hypothetical protein